MLRSFKKEQVKFVFYVYPRAFPFGHLNILCTLKKELQGEKRLVAFAKHVYFGPPFA